jgi:CDP-diacylglycerol--glycerol-3-phosphate 3-phosphatidyltransferase
MTVPTTLTLLRILFTVVIVLLLLLPGWLPNAVALGCFILASLTDWLDGFLARQRRQSTALGALLDPIADKILVLGILGTFVWRGLIPAWMVLVIAAREVLVTALRLMAVRRGIVLPAEQTGKWKTTAQMVTVGLILITLLIRELGGCEQALPTLERLVYGGLWIAMLLTVVSGATFVWKQRQSLGRLICG